MEYKVIGWTTIRDITNGQILRRNQDHLKWHIVEKDNEDNVICSFYLRKQAFKHLRRLQQLRREA